MHNAALNAALPGMGGDPNPFAFSGIDHRNVTPRAHGMRAATLLGSARITAVVFPSGIDLIMSAAEETASNSVIEQRAGASGHLARLGTFAAAANHLD